MVPKAFWKAAWVTLMGLGACWPMLAFGKVFQASPADTSAVLGDVVTLQLEGAPREAVTWTFLEEEVATGNSCELRTKAMGLGTFTLIATIVLDDIQYRLPFYVRVATPDPDPEQLRLPQKLTPDLVARDASAQAVTPSQWQVQALFGKGFWYREKVSEAVDTAPKPLRGTSKVKARPRSLIRVSSPRGECRISSLSLAQVNSVIETVVALKGEVICHNTSSEAWGLAVTDRLQLELPPGGAVVVRSRLKEPETAFVGVVQTGAVVAYLTEAGPTQHFLVPGESLNWVAGEITLAAPQPGRFETDLAYAYEELDIRAVTLAQPGVMAEELQSQWSKVQSLVQGGKLLDGAVAVYPLLTGPLTLDQWITVGVLYQRLHLYQAARKVFQHVLSFEDGEPQAHYYLGVMALTEGRWRQARKFLQKADPWDDAIAQKRAYYNGVSDYAVRRTYSAEGQFRYSLWDPLDPELSKSSQTYLDKIAAASRFDFSTALAFGYNTNARHLNPEVASELSGLYADTFVDFDLGMNVWGFRSDQGQLLFPLHLGVTGFLQPGSSDLGAATIALPAQGSFYSGPKASAWYGVTVEAGFRGSSVGGNFVGLETAARMELAVPRWWELHVAWTPSYILDTATGQVSGYDPWLDEPSSLAHQSHRATRYELGVRPTFGQWQSSFSLGYQTRSYTNSAARQTDHSGIVFSAAANGPFLPRLTGGVGLGYQIISLPDFIPEPDASGVTPELGRSDSGFHFNTHIGFYLWSHVTTELRLGYRSRSSNLELYSYSAIETALAVTYEY